jgi:hypothetical protein
MEQCRKKPDGEKKRITTKPELLKELQVSSLPAVLKNPAAEARLAQLAPTLSPELVQEVLKEVPELKKAFNELIAAIKSVGTSLEQTKRLRWEVLQDLAEDDKLSPEQILEAMRIISDIEKAEGIDWTEVFKTVAKVLGAVVGLPILLVTIALMLPFGLGSAEPVADDDRRS